MSWMPLIARSRRAAVEGRLDLARHRLRRRVAHEVAHVGARVRGQVEQLVLGHARPRVAGDVAHRVAAALAARQPRFAELADRLLDFRQRYVVHLDVLARRHVALVQRRVLLDDVRELLHLLRRDAAERQLHADHLHVRLALAVDALLQAELDELVFGRLPVEELRRLGLEVVVLLLQDRDHVARDVLVDLRVGQGAPAVAWGDSGWLVNLGGGAGTWLHGLALSLQGSSSHAEQDNIHKDRRLSGIFSPGGQTRRFAVHAFQQRRTSPGIGRG